jgi:hypothetical protein
MAFSYGMMLPLLIQTPLMAASKILGRAKAVPRGGGRVKCRKNDRFGQFYG